MNQVRRKLAVPRAERPALQTKEGGPGGGMGAAAGRAQRGRRRLDDSEERPSGGS